MRSVGEAVLKKEGKRRRRYSVDTRAMEPITTSSISSEGQIYREELHSSAERNGRSTSPMAKRQRLTEPVTQFLTSSRTSDVATEAPGKEAPPSPATDGNATTAPTIAMAGEDAPIPPRKAWSEEAVQQRPSPISLLPRKMPRKTPGSTPPSGRSTPSLSSPAATLTPASPKLASLHQRWEGLLRSVLMKGRSSQEEERVRELSTRIVQSIPGTLEETRDAFHTLVVNLKDEKNVELRRSLIEGTLLVEHLVRMDDRELANPELRKKIEEKMEERSKDTNLVELKKAITTSSTLFKCRICGVRDTSWEQKQTRSGDEPMTVIITCNKCGSQWRK